MMDFIRSATEELSALPFFSRPSSVEETLGASGTFSIDLDFSKASKQLETFMAGTGGRSQWRLDTAIQVFNDMNTVKPEIVPAA